jgi:hypothetical protein
MPKFRQKSSSQRREPKPTASWLVLGITAARLVACGQKTTHITPVKSRDHRKKYSVGQRLSVRAFVGGPTEAHIHITSVQRVPAGSIDFHTARELGHVRVDDFREAWVAEHDDTYTGTAPLERFDSRHAHRDVWVLRFALDRSDFGGLPAAHSEEGYTDNPARAMPEEMPAVRDQQWEFHIGRPARDREARRQTMVAVERMAQPLDKRANAARAAARIKGVDVAREFRVYDRLAAHSTRDRALRQLELIESRVFPRLGNAA